MKTHLTAAVAGMNTRGICPSTSRALLPHRAKHHAGTGYAPPPRTYHRRRVSPLAAPATRCTARACCILPHLPGLRLHHLPALYHTCPRYPYCPTTAVLPPAPARTLLARALTCTHAYRLFTATCKCFTALTIPLHAPVARPPLCLRRRQQRHCLATTTAFTRTHAARLRTPHAAESAVRAPACLCRSFYLFLRSTLHHLA